MSVAPSRVGAGRNIHPFLSALADPSRKTLVVPSATLGSALVIELNDGMWLIKQPGLGIEPGVIRGYLFRVEAADGIRYLARLPHLYPTQGARLGEFWEWERAVAAVLAVSD